MKKNTPMFFERLDTLLFAIDNRAITDEWYLSDFIDSNIANLSSESAFIIMQQYIDFMIDQPYHPELVDVLYALWRQADTAQPFITQPKNKQY